MQQHVPHPSVQAFERFLAGIIAQQRCVGCGKPLGSAPRRMRGKKRQFHPACDDTVEAYVRVLEGEHT